jgi:hypothetical protein
MHPTRPGAAATHDHSSVALLFVEVGVRLARKEGRG